MPSRKAKWRTHLGAAHAVERTSPRLPPLAASSTTLALRFFFMGLIDGMALQSSDLGPSGFAHPANGGGRIRACNRGSAYQRAFFALIGGEPDNITISSVSGSCRISPWVSSGREVCNQGVTSSNLVAGTIFFKNLTGILTPLGGHVEGHVIAT